MTNKAYTNRVTLSKTSIDMLARYASVCAVAVALMGCATPKTVAFYDEQCDVVARKMVLDVKPSNISAACSNAGCLNELVGAAVVLTSSTIISGSIVVAGNVVYWFERRKNCKPTRTVPEPTLLHAE